MFSAKEPYVLRLSMMRVAWRVRLALLRHDNSGVFDVVAVGLAFFLAINAVETDTFSVLVVQDPLPLEKAPNSQGQTPTLEP